MPRADEYVGAAAWCERERTYHLASGDNRSADSTLAARCVRAMAALASREVLLQEPYDFGAGQSRAVSKAWVATTTKGVFPATDPLDAITAALGGDDA